MTAPEDTRAFAARIAMSMYIGEPCRICGAVLTEEDVMNGAVFAGYSIDNASRSAHKDCWTANKPKSEWVFPIDAPSRVKR